MIQNNKENYETVVQSHSYVFGGLIGCYDRIVGNPYGINKNKRYEKYRDYMDKEYYEEGYHDAYTQQGVYNIFAVYQEKTPEELLHDIENASKPYECILNGGIKIKSGEFKIVNPKIVNDIMEQGDEPEKTR